MAEDKRRPSIRHNTIRREREHQRYRINTIAKVKKKGYVNWSDVRLLTLGSKGASFLSTEYAKNDIIEFFLAGPNGAKSFHFSAHVVWVRDGRVGVEFIDGL